MKLQFFYMLPFTIMLFTKAHAAEVSIGMVDFCPYMCVGTANKGFIVEIVEQAFKKNGIAAKFTVKPWARAVADTRVGKLDGLLAPGKNEAPGLMFPETPVAVQQNCFYAKSTSQWNYRSFNDVKNGTFISYIGFGNRLDLEKSIGVGVYKKISWNLITTTIICLAQLAWLTPTVLLLCGQTLSVLKKLSRMATNY
ncbi:hypothetical protein [Chromobacterium haemolyticum]|uniref:hypothetical protein n=1 Tax=Chromobacterium haemolyticum TaxID=394935 RepID=UPI0029538B85|nr:hypothetical protein [Chromobacterium haemolyticum]WON83892.1 hypothetical protein OK026_22740 [Chromobacterium haemolyticum]